MVSAYLPQTLEFDLPAVLYENPLYMNLNIIPWGIDIVERVISAFCHYNNNNVRFPILDHKHIRQWHTLITSVWFYSIYTTYYKKKLTIRFIQTGIGKK